MALYIQLSTQNVFTKYLSISSITGGNSVNTTQLASTVESLLTNTVVPPFLSTQAIFTSTLTASNVQVGWNSDVSPIQFYGTGTYLNSVIAEVSTGATTQELLLFRGSTATDRIRMQTTGSILFEPGVSQRLWPTVPSNVTPAMVINASSNVGIQTATPQTALDVAGTGRFQTASTMALQVSTINGQAYTTSGVTSNLLVPFSTFGTTSTFLLQTNTASSLVTFGTTQTAGQSQYYFGDLYNQLNFSTITSPTLVLEQTFPAQNTVVSTFRSSATFTVPANVSLLNVHLWGSGGAQYPGLGPGGGGAYLTGYLRVLPSQVLNIQLNLGGGSGTARGGGCTAIFNGASTFANVIAVAGAGGGGGTFATTLGGGGGIVTGRSGTYRALTGGGANPGSQTAGGSGSAWQLKGSDGSVGGGAGFFGGGAGFFNSVDDVGGGGGSSLFSNLINWKGEDGQNGGLAGGQGSPYYSSGFGNCNIRGFSGAAVLAWSSGIRNANLFESRGATQTIGFGISQSATVGLNVSNINPSVTLEVNGLGSFSTLQATTLIPTNLTVPFSTINPSLTGPTQSMFAMNTISSGTQVAFGTTQAYGPVGKYSQIYAGDLRALRGEFTNTDPLLLLEQDFPLVASSNVIVSVFSTTVNAFVVPSSVFMAKVYLWGQGGSSVIGGSNGASGAFVSGAFTVTPGETIGVAVNYQGGAGAVQGANGGGLSGVFRSSINWSTSIAIAAGGGGGGTFPTGGGGFPGYPVGGSATYRGATWITTQGGTQTSGGTSVSLTATYGGALRGGPGWPADTGGGGGGAGYFGGSGGYWNTVDGVGGGGGSSYIGGLISTSIVLENGLTGTGVLNSGGGKFAPFYRSTIGDTNNSGFAVIVFPKAFRKANLLEVRAASQSTITGIDYTLAMGIQVPVINSTIALDVGGISRASILSSQALYVSSFYTATRQATPMFVTF